MDNEGTSADAEGRWAIDRGEPRDAPASSPWRDDRSELTYSNPFGQEVERVWFEGRVVFAVELGELRVDPQAVQLAQEYQVVYDVDLGPAGIPAREPDRVPGQLNIYDSIPGMDAYSPLWRFNYVVVPRSYEPNSLRSERDCLESGYPIRRSNVVEN
jgi:hypothetical protein